LLKAAESVLLTNQRYVFSACVSAVNCYIVRRRGVVTMRGEGGVET